MQPTAPSKNPFIFNIQKYNVYDGPGVRTLVFFNGCPLRCQWCANPEGLRHTHEILYKQDACTACGNCASACPAGIHKLYSTGQHTVNREINCMGCRKCERRCYPRALTITGQRLNIEQIVESVLEDRIFYETSGGGVTLGGGDPIAQADAAAALLHACQLEGIHTAVETSGHGSLANLLKIAEHTDLFLYDIKHMDTHAHRQYTGVDNTTILSNLGELMARGYAVQVRLPLLKGINAQDAYIEQLVSFLLPYAHLPNLQGIDLLPYHKFGVSRYEQLGMDYTLHDLEALSQTDLTRILGHFERANLPANIMQH